MLPLPPLLLHLLLHLLLPPTTTIMCTINQTYLVAEAACQQSLADTNLLLAFAVTCGTGFVVVCVALLA
jgi:hypothetical protein